MSSEDTRTALMDAAVRLTATQGVKALTARGIAGEAGANQALVYYHFDGVPGLLREAYARATRALVQSCADDLARATSFADLHRIGTALAERSTADGSAVILSQLIASAHVDPQMAQSVAQNLDVWHREIGAALARIMSSHRLAEALDLEAATRTLSTAFIGMITVGALPGAPAGDPMRGLGRLSRLLDRVLRLTPAPLARRILREEADPGV